MEVPDPTSSLEVSPHWLRNVDREEIPFVLIDCREEDEHQFCHLDGDRLLPLSRFADPNTLASLPQDRDSRLVFYCHHGMRSAQAANYLRSQGFTNSFSLAGGIDLWSQLIDPSIPRY